MSSQIQRHLKTEELYDKVLRAMLDEDVTTGQVRGKLDAILSQGKIEGRLSAYGEGSISSPSHDRLIEDWQRIVDSA